MEKTFRNTAVFFVLVILGVQWGFYRVYTSEFPDFKNNTSIDHIHGALMMTWMLLLVAQPTLISLGKPHIHRAIGKISYVLGPVIIVALFLIGKTGYWNEIRDNLPMNQVWEFSVLDIRGFLIFALFWSLAMLNLKNPSAHMRYMIGTGILAIGPGIGRGLQFELGVSTGNALTITDVIEILIPATMLGYDIFKKHPLKPNLVILLVLIAGGLLWQFRDSEGWRAFARWYAGAFY